MKEVGCLAVLIFCLCNIFLYSKVGGGGQEGVVNQRKVFQMFRKKIFDKVVEGGTTNSSQAKAELHQCMR